MFVGLKQKIRRQHLIINKNILNNNTLSVIGVTKQSKGEVIFLNMLKSNMVQTDLIVTNVIIQLIELTDLMNIRKHTSRR